MLEQYQRLNFLGHYSLYTKRSTKEKNEMVKKSKLFAALDAHKGRDYEKERQKKLAKAAEKKKKAQKGESKQDEEVCCSRHRQFDCVY